MKILITGAAGFIGMHSSLKFLNSKFTVLGIDNLNNYYDRNLKLKRLKLLKKNKRFKFKKTGTKLQTGIYNFIKWYNKYYG